MRLAMLGLIAMLIMATAVPAAPATPLLTLAESRHYLHPTDDLQHQGAVLASFSMLDAVYQRYGDNGHCDSTACKHHLVEVLREIGLGYSHLGLHLLSLNYYQAVMHYADDEAMSHADVGGELLMLGRLDDAGAAYAKALAIADGKNGEIEQYAGAYFLVANQLAKAREQYAACAQLPGDNKRIVQYCAIGLVLAKIRGSDAGTPSAIDADKEWPGPALLYLRGEIDEGALAHVVESTEDASTQREHLSEALYYAGELSLRHGDNATALRYFRANAALKVGGFLETLLSVRRIEQLHGNDDPPPHSVPASHVPIS